jgi:hypothetical protein
MMIIYGWDRICYHYSSPSWKVQKLRFKVGILNAELVKSFDAANYRSG